jgi:nitroreductase
VIEDILMTASTAPSGANKQPWTFCAVSDPAIKKEIRIAAEQEEYESYH